MKKILNSGIILGILILSICSCGSEKSTDALKVESSAVKADPSNLSCENLLDAPEDFEGQVITLDAVCWGKSPSIDGKEILMSLGDIKPEGLQQAHVLVHFLSEQEKEIQDIDENAPITLTATVGAYEYGALRLLKAKVIPK